MIYGYARVSTAAQDETGQVRQLKAAGCEKVFREKITGTTADRPQLRALMKKLTPGDVVITPAVDRLSRDTTDLLVIARDMQRAGGRYPVTGRTVPRYHIRLCRDHLRHPWRCGEARTPPHSRTHRARPCRRQGKGRQIRPQADTHAAPAERGPQAPRSGRDAAQCRPQLQCQSEHDFAARRLKNMASLLTQRDFRLVQNLPFCYICGKTFAAGETKNSDHVPPENIFEKKDRMPLKLATHYHCNHSYRQIDEKIGQVIALRRGHVPAKQNRRLKITYNLSTGQSALTNLDIEDAIWRWIRGFHSALYHQPFPPDDPAKGYRSGALQTPFHRTLPTPYGGMLKPVLPQHQLAVRTIKENRARNNLDRLVSNRGKLVYECVWREADSNAGWVCISR
jgi:hypothetical protein